MPYISTRTVRTTTYSGGGSPQVTSVTYSSDNPDDSGSSGFDQGGSARYQTPRAAQMKSQINPDAPPPSSQGSGIQAHSAVPVSRGGQSAGPSQECKTLAADLARRGALFEDPEFPAVDSSLFFSKKPPKKFDWKRPRDICPNPEFIAGGASRFDVRQGELGDCWLLAAVACLSLHQEILDQVVPPDQNFSSPDYCGMIRFRFWRFGEWREVVVDDRLPTYGGRLVFMHSTQSNEFWSALLEKAYAKLSGSYEALKGGSTSEALEDFTGGITEFFDLKNAPPKNLLDIMLRAHDRCSLMGCSIEADPTRLEAELPNGLIMGHAYSITDLRMIDISVPGKTGKIPLIRVRNPWGNEAEWKGAWGDKSREWQLISEADRKKCGLTFDDDGEFWMAFQDFVKNFEKLEICNMGPQSLEGDQLSGQSKRRWEMCIENGVWKRRVSAGGCRNFLDTFWTNPQFRVSVVDPDENDDENMGTIIVGLMQKDMRKKRKEGVELYTIGYVIYKLPDSNCGPLDLNFFKRNASIARSPTFINTREVCGRHKLEPATYVVVPSTFDPNQEADFILRIFSEKPNQSGELDEQTGMATPQILAAPTSSNDSKVPAPMKAEDEAQIAGLRETFKSIAGVDMEIDAYELRDVLNAAFKRDFKFEGFGVETTRSMVAMMDYDQSGKLGFDEFRVLWTDLRLWKTAFKKYDQDQSGNFNSFELRTALNAVGFRVSNKVFNSLVMRYASKDGVVFFDDFILCCVRLKTVFETFKSQQKNQEGLACFDQDTFIQCIMYV